VPFHFPVTLLDYSSTAAVSTLTAAGYLKGEVNGIGIPTWLLGGIILVGWGVGSMAGVRESAKGAMGVMVFHVRTFLNNSIIS
jgi:hypothetical protein